MWQGEKTAWAVNNCSEAGWAGMPCRRCIAYLGLGVQLPQQILSSEAGSADCGNPAAAHKKAHHMRRQGTGF